MISAIILAAGESKRMGQPKMLLPWGKTTVLGHVIATFQKAGIQDIVVVVGGARAQVEEILKQSAARAIFNEQYAKGGMLVSLQRGLEAQLQPTQAALIALGDQPQIQERTVDLISEAFESSTSRLILPSFRLRRGHPWLVERSLWREVLEIPPERSPRDFLNAHADEIQYVQVDNASILADLDTMEEYRKARP